MDESTLAKLFGRTDELVTSALSDQEAREAHLCKSEYVGILDERQVIRLTLVDTLGPFPGDWGDRFGYVFHEGDPGQTCNELLWWTASKPPLEKGETGDFNCTVTTHEEYMGKKQTKLARIKPVNTRVEAAKKRRAAEEIEDDGDIPF
jgi:hypothetical protein